MAKALENRDDMVIKFIPLFGTVLSGMEFFILGVTTIRQSIDSIFYI